MCHESNRINAIVSVRIINSLQCHTIGSIYNGKLMRNWRILSLWFWIAKTTFSSRRWILIAFFGWRKWKFPSWTKSSGTFIFIHRWAHFSHSHSLIRVDSLLFGKANKALNYRWMSFFCIKAAYCVALLIKKHHDRWCLFNSFFFPHRLC